jgi:hypothetical protein
VIPQHIFFEIDYQGFKSLVGVEALQGAPDDDEGAQRAPDDNDLTVQTVDEDEDDEPPKEPTPPYDLQADTTISSLSSPASSHKAPKAIWQPTYETTSWLWVSFSTKWAQRLE